MKKNLGTLAGVICGLAIAIGVASAGSYASSESADVVTASLLNESTDFALKPKGGSTPGTCQSGKPPRCYRPHCGWTADFKPECPAKDQCDGREYCMMITDTQGRTVCATNLACVDSPGGGPIVIQ